MTFHPVNHDKMRNENIMTVLRCIQEEGPIVRRAIKDRTGLSWGSVSAIVNMLLEKNLIVEKKVAEDSAKGRHPTGLDIATVGFAILGIDINRSGLTVVMTDLKSNIIHSVFQKLENKEREAVLAHVYQMLDNMIECAGAEKREVLGIGIAMQGSVDVSNGVSRYTPYFENWENIPLVKLLEERYHCDVVLEHSPECSAIYETWYGIARNVDNLLYIRLGHSIGVSILIDGKVLRGADGNAGEFGHTIAVAENGELCRCGRRGCLETIASETSVIRHIFEDLQGNETGPIMDVMQGQDLAYMTMEHVYRAYCEGDLTCKRHIDLMAKHLAIGITNMINLFNPTLVVLGGDMVRFEGMFIQQVRNYVQSLAWKYSRKTIVTSTKDNTAALGATLLVMRNFFSAEDNTDFFE